ncbi:c-type cytochrome [Burkholderia ubonensis]|nr:hypothetical protein [Burkholderia ubonensis]
MAGTLHAYKSGLRSGGMAPMNRPFSDRDIDNRTAYITALRAQQ